MDVKSLQTLFAVSLIAALAPIVVAALPRPRIPQVVVLILCGVIIGHQGLGLQNTDSIKLISNVGLGFLFLLAGYELDPQLLRERAGKLAITGWVLSAVIAVGAVAILGAFGYVKDFVPVGLALTTTALGTLLPILHDNDMLAGQFGRYVLAAGAVGELLPIVAISLFLTDRAQWAALISIAAVCVVALLLTFLPRVDGADHPAVVGGAAVAAAPGGGALRPGRGAGCAAGRHGAAPLDPADGGGGHLAGGKARRARLWLLHTGLLRHVRHDAGRQVDRAAPVPAHRVLPPAAGGPGPAVTAGLPACPAQAPAAGNDVRGGDHDAAADRAGRDRPQRRRHDPGQRGRPGRRRCAVGAGLPLDRRRAGPARPPGSRHPRGDDRSRRGDRGPGRRRGQRGRRCPAPSGRPGRRPGRAGTVS